MLRWVVALFMVAALIGCGSSSDTDEAVATTERGTTTPVREGLTAVAVGNRLQAAGVPITYSIIDTSEVESSEFPGLTATAETATDALDLSIEVYDTTKHRQEASAIQDRNLKQRAPALVPFDRKAECGRIIVSALVSEDSTEAAAQERDFAEVRKALASAYGPC